jgi:hypothetical protein
MSIPLAPFLHFPPPLCSDNLYYSPYSEFASQCILSIHCIYLICIVGTVPDCDLVRTNVCKAFVCVLMARKFISIMSQMSIYACTLCSYVLHFSMYKSLWSVALVSHVCPHECPLRDLISAIGSSKCAFYQPGPSTLRCVQSLLYRYLSPMLTSVVFVHDGYRRDGLCYCEW